MKCLRVFAFVAMAAIIFAASQSQAQNLLTDPGFEDPTKFTQDGPPFVGFWEGFQGGGASSSLASTDPHSGASHLSLNINNADNTFAGAFQDVGGLSAGQPVNFSLWHKTTALPYTLAIEMRIEWRNTGTNTEISRTPNLTTSPTDVYTQLALSSVVPAGADTARAVYAIQSFTNGASPDLGTVFVDDFSVTVPEPSTIAIGAVGLVGLYVARRRKA